MKNFLIASLVLSIIFVAGCASVPGTAPANTSGNAASNTRDDFGCWPPSCSYIPDPSGRQMCEDWKAGKQVVWPSCTVFSGYPGCQKLCEFEKSSGQAAQQQTQAFNTLPSLVKAEFASDVTDKDKLSIIQGTSAMDFYLKKWFGKSINQPVGLAADAGQSASLLEGAQVETKNGTMVIEIKTGSDIWKQQIEETRNSVSAHEYVHVYQVQNGCGNFIAQDKTLAPKWFYEGEAVLLSFEVTKEAGWNPYFSTQQMIPMAKQATGSLKSFETQESITSSNALSAYPLFATALDYLTKDRPIKTLDDFCANLGAGQDVPTAFQNAFGISLEKFYGDFEAYRNTW